jgi:hypothetical protein
MDPVSYAGLAKDLGLTDRVREDALARAAQEGAEIMERRLGITRETAGPLPVQLGQ